MSSMPHHNDVVYLIAQYLQAKGLFASSLALQQESGLDVTWLRGCSRELALLRRWVFDGDVGRARALLQPLESVLDFPDEMNAARLALDELEVLVMKTRSKNGSQLSSGLAKAKLTCFEKLVPLFRASVDADESDVFKYIVMPKLQLVGLIHDAVVFNPQSGAGGSDCIGVACNVNARDVADAEEEGKVLLLLDKPSNEGPVDEYASCSPEVGDIAHSVDWTSQRSRRPNPLVLSMSTYKRPWHDDSSGDEAEVTAEDSEDVVGMAKWSISTKKETVDAAVSCRLEEKETADAAVNCKPGEKETSDVAVSCGLGEWSDASTQTENLNPCDGGEAGSAMNGGEEAEQNQRDEPQRNNSVAAGSGEDQAELCESRRSMHERQDQSGDNKKNILPNSTNSSKHFGASWARTSSRNLAVGVDTPEASREDCQLEQKEVSAEASSSPEDDDSEELQQQVDDETEFDAEMSLLKRPPQHYDELTLDQVVCASVIAEVKEPQAVRALDVHPSGAQLAVGTNARALRVFDLSTSLQQRQQQLSWSSSLNMLLPLLPVALERHKHHDSGIYCVSYNRHLLHSAGATSMVASGAADGSVKVLVVRDKDPLQRQQVEELWIQRGDVNGSMGKTRALEFASPHLLWVSSTNDRRLRCWDVQRTQKISSSGPYQTLDGHVGEVQAIAMPQPSTSGSVNTMLLSAALDKTVRLWDTRSRRCERLVTSGPHAAFSLHFNPTNEKLAVSGHQDGSVSLWDLRSTAREALQVVVPHEDECRSVRWSPGGQWMLSAAFDGTLCIMAATASRLQPVTSYHKHYGKVLQAQWHPTEPAFVSSGADKRVKLWAFA